MPTPVRQLTALPTVVRLAAAPAARQPLPVRALAAYDTELLHETVANVLGAHHRAAPVVAPREGLGGGHQLRRKPLHLRAQLRPPDGHLLVVERAERRIIAAQEEGQQHHLGNGHERGNVVPRHGDQADAVDVRQRARVLEEGRGGVADSL